MAPQSGLERHIRALTGEGVQPFQHDPDGMEGDRFGTVAGQVLGDFVSIDEVVDVESIGEQDEVG